MEYFHRKSRGNKNRGKFPENSVWVKGFSCSFPMEHCCRLLVSKENKNPIRTQVFSYFTKYETTTLLRRWASLCTSLSNLCYFEACTDKYPYLPNMLQFLCYKFLCSKQPKFSVPMFLNLVVFHFSSYLIPAFFPIPVFWIPSFQTGP